MKSIQYLLIITLLSACTTTDPEGKGESGPYTYPPAYILGFCPVENLICNATHKKFEINESKKKIGFITFTNTPTTLNIECRFFLTDDNYQYRYPGNPDNQPIPYWNKIKEMGDTLFDKYQRMFERNYGIDYGPFDGLVVNGTITAIDITCNQDIDNRHPAGSSLSDIISIVYSDHYWVTLNGYVSYKGKDAYNVTDKNQFPNALRIQRLSEFNLTPHPYIGCHYQLYADNLQFSEDCVFTIYVNTAEGKQVQVEAKNHWDWRDTR